MSTPRVRVVGWTVTPAVMVDDGDNLTPVPVQPVQIPASHWEAFKNGGDDQAIAQITEQVLAQAAEQEPKPNRAARRAKPKP